MNIKGFTGLEWWKHKNPAYRKACFNKSLKETTELKGKYDFFIKQTIK